MIKKTLGKRDLHNIALIGFMAAGKTTVGKALAFSMNWNFLDTDLEIQNTTGLSIPEIFQLYGETRFRSEENLLLKRLNNNRNQVIATGGGMMINPENWELLSKHALIIYLYATVEKVIERAGDRSHRPLLKGPREKIEALWHLRQPIYNQADIIIDTTYKEPDEVVSEILTKIGKQEQGFIDLEMIEQDKYLRWADLTSIPK